MTNNSLRDRRTIKRLQKMYPQGTRVELIEMNDPYSSLIPGEKVQYQ